MNCLICRSYVTRSAAKCVVNGLTNHCKRRLAITSTTRTMWTLNSRVNPFLSDSDRNRCSYQVSVRCLSKTKDKPKDKKKGSKPKVVLSDEEMSELIPISELKIELNSVTDRFRQDLIANVSVRSNPQSIEHLVVDMNGQKHSLNELAQINRKSPQLVIINMASTPEAIKPVLTALAESGMNLSPQQEGTVLYVPIPKVTREHREGLATNARTMCQKAKDELKAIHSSFAAYVKRQKRAQVSEELIFNVNQNLKHLIDDRLQECDHILDQKLKELLN